MCMYLNYELNKLTPKAKRSIFTTQARLSSACVTQ